MGINRWGDNHQQTNSWSPPSERMHWDVIWVVQVLGLSRISLLKSYREAVRVESSILASPLLVIERSHGFGAVRLEKKDFCFKGLPLLGCYCLVATACLLLLVCCLFAACLRLACGLPAPCLVLLPAAAAATADAWCKHFTKQENNSLGRLVWRWREVRARDTSRGRECVCFWLVEIKGVKLLQLVLAGCKQLLSTHSIRILYKYEAFQQRTVIFPAVRCGLRPLLATCLIDETDRAMVIRLPVTFHYQSAVTFRNIAEKSPLGMIQP